MYVYMVSSIEYKQSVSLSFLLQNQLNSMYVGISVKRLQLVFTHPKVGTTNII